MSIDFSSIKLVIWDLDDTFWQGTLSEGPVTAIGENISSVRLLTDHGIVNSICSKNNKEIAEYRLNEMGILDFFVFRSIDWTPKGQRIAQLIKDMGLRPKNCLFIDDNMQNLNEAKFYSKELMTAEPCIISELNEYFGKQPAKDTAHSRLKQYVVLEQKHTAKIEASSNEAFLYDSMTQVQLHDNCIDEIERIHELIFRTNQLNFTKLRSTREELEGLLNDKSANCGYVTVQDKFGDYGIVGFYAIKNGQLVHFLFSCRTIGQGVEQYVYATLGYPKLEIVGEVVNKVTNAPAPMWINKKNVSSEKKVQVNKGKVVLKGGCDLFAMAEYLNTDTVITEFTYFGKRRCNNIEHVNHSINYLNLPFLSIDQQRALTDELIMNDEEMYHTAMYDDDVVLLCLPTMMECNLGIYRNKKTGLKFAFGEYSFPLTDPKCWELYVNNKVFTADNTFTLEWLQDFSKKWEFIGHLTPVQIIENAEILLTRISPNAKVCYFLGSETPFLKNKKANYEGRHLVYKQINDLMREFSMKHKDRVLLLDFNEFITGQNDFTNNINHFVRRVYYDVATKVNGYIVDLTGVKLTQRSRFYLWKKTFVDKIDNVGFFQSSIYSYLRLPYVFVKKVLKVSF